MELLLVLLLLLIFFVSKKNSFGNDTQHHFICNKKDGKLNFIDNGSFQERNLSTFRCIEQADKIYNWKDFNDIRVYSTDKSQSDFSYSTEDNNFSKCVPDFTFDKWTSVGIYDYDKCVDGIIQAGKKTPKINKVGWIGNLNVTPIRSTLYEIGQAHKNIMDIISMDWKDGSADNTGKQHTNGVYLSLPELVEIYSVLIDIEGNGWSARTKFLLWSGRPLLLVDRQYKEYYYEYLVPWEHYIPVKRDLSDLLQRVEWCLNNINDAKRIATNAQNFSRKYLSRSACYKQWNFIITGQKPKF